MAKTIFRVKNLNADSKYKAGSGFWFKTGYDGGVNTQGTVDPADDTITPASDTFNNDDYRGVFIWISADDAPGAVGDLVDAGTPLERFVNPQDFVLDGDSTDKTSIAGMVLLALENSEYIWIPKNPEYNTVAPLMKDGVTPNPDFDPSGNPLNAAGAPVQTTMSKAVTFEVETKATVIASKAKTKAKK